MVDKTGSEKYKNYRLDVNQGERQLKEIEEFQREVREFTLLCLYLSLSNNDMYLLPLDEGSDHSVEGYSEAFQQLLNNGEIHMGASGNSGNRYVLAFRVQDIRTKGGHSQCPKKYFRIRSQVNMGQDSDEGYRSFWVTLDSFDFPLIVDPEEFERIAPKILVYNSDIESPEKFQYRLNSLYDYIEKADNFLDMQNLKNGRDPFTY
jgi:hypothetical protein